MSRSDFLILYLPILITVLVAVAIASTGYDRWSAFRRALITSMVLLTSYHFFRALVEAANMPDVKEADMLVAAFYGVRVGLGLGGLVGLAVGYAARILIARKKKW